LPYQAFRQFLDVLRQHGELVDVNRPIALNDVGKAMKQATALFGSCTSPKPRVARRGDFATWFMTLVIQRAESEWDFTDWRHASGYDANDRLARHMFECLLAYAMREGRAGLN
jgi:hypothetical protein